MTPCSKCAWLSNAEGGAEYAATAGLPHEQSQSLCNLLELVDMVWDAFPQTQPHAQLCKTYANRRAVKASAAHTLWHRERCRLLWGVSSDKDSLIYRYHEMVLVP